MRLHEKRELFAEAILAASRSVEEGGLGIKDVYIEKDYWICRSLSLMAKNDSENRAIFKGGTSLTKAFGIGNRFSEDIDVAIAEADSLSGNQLKNLIKRISKSMTEGLQEIDMPGLTSKGSRFHRVYYSYPRAGTKAQVGAVKAGQLLVEINSFANPYPIQRRMIRSFLTDFLALSNNSGMIEDFEMQPFELNVLDSRRTLTEKLVSLIRNSLAEDCMIQMAAKIRHFYDLYYLFQDKEVKSYIDSKSFKSDFNSLMKEDQNRFKEPSGWDKKLLKDSILVKDLHNVWKDLQKVYLKELPDLAYREIPSTEEIEISVKSIIEKLF